MKKALTIVFVSLSLVLILDSMNAGHAIMMFLLAGVIPGTTIALDANRMLEIFALLLGFTLSRLCMNAVRSLARQRSSGVFKRYNTLSPKL